MNLRLNFLVLSMAAVSVAPAFAQTPDRTMPGMDHSTMNMHAVPAPMGAMPGMDHSQMNMGAAPAKAGAMPEMKSMDASQPAADTGMAGMDMQAQGGSAPADARDPHAYSSGYTLDTGPYGLAPGQRLRLADEHHFASVRLDRLERVYSSGSYATAYEARASFGSDYNKLLIKSEGEVAQGKLQEGSTELLWDHAIATFWNSQLGLRYDGGTSPSRNWLAFGVQGLAPYWFEVNAEAYLGNNGRSALRLGADYELLLTQKLILQPRVEVNFYGQEDKAREIGSGLSSGVAGLRLRYEISRQLAPYVGVERNQKFGNTADLARAEGLPAGTTRWVAGLRAWF
jgi:copper resistance protein B